MLTRLRSKVKNFFEKIASGLASIGVGPNTITLSSLLVSGIAFLAMYCWRSIPLFLIMILLSGLFDALDGALARITGTVSRFGAFLDSTTDRLSDTLYILSYLALGVNPYLIGFLLSFSLLISYTRSRAESLGLKMEGVGIIERAERILWLAGTALLYYVSLRAVTLSLLVLLVLSIITFLQRIMHVYRSLYQSADKS
ncbi:MAG: CDP-alcohol phosphatidyltransferase family protein [Crenarchaeota archaeon]|nr:CDP-alcohol phosphatidyltransferase family protein [Thermoproteota archaeon]